jgi:hypothetical protein
MKRVVEKSAKASPFLPLLAFATIRVVFAVLTSDPDMLPTSFMRRAPWIWPAAFRVAAGFTLLTGTGGPDFMFIPVVRT